MSFARKGPASMGLDERKRRVGNSAAPGEAVLRAVHVEGVGVVYTRARPQGRETVDELRESVARMKRRTARRGLPEGLPPMPPTVAGMGDDFGRVVRQAVRKAEVDDTLVGQIEAVGQMVGDAFSYIVGDTAQNVDEAAHAVVHKVDELAQKPAVLARQASHKVKRQLTLGKRQLNQGVDEMVQSKPVTLGRQASRTLKKQLNLGNARTTRSRTAPPEVGSRGGSAHGEGSDAGARVSFVTSDVEADVQSRQAARQ